MVHATTKQMSINLVIVRVSLSLSFSLLSGTKRSTSELND
jgi:hypothetical protein